jgi:hypothetical protein
MDKVILDRIKKESSELKNVLDECVRIGWSKEGYTKLSLEELSKFYDKIDDGLICCNLIAQDVSGVNNSLALELNQYSDSLGRFLESQLIKIVVNMTLRDKALVPPKKFKESLYMIKIKDKKYYDELFELSKMNLNYRERIYELLQK